MVFHSIRVVVAAAKFNLIMTMRFFSGTAIALRLFAPIMTLGSAWVLFNLVYKGFLSPEFESAVGTSSYLSFITVGNAFYVFVFAAAFVVGRVMFWERATGTIEAAFMTPMNRLAYMAGIMIAASLNSLIDFIAIFLIGTLFGFQVTSFNSLLFFSSVLLTAVALFGVGLITNAITLTFRDRTNTANTLMILFMVFSGLVCPIELMPHWAQAISKALPLTYGLRIMRASLLGVEAFDPIYDVAALCILGIIYIGIGAFALKLIERNLKKKALLSVL
ncbi:MAG: ABC transporter permease [Candidatus Bathyarchaeota archaeon]|nr:ABC transporter permease [Candidatus Bathyarchaeota archaeon]MDH5495319.1 ABC transporter permease [Candidatus Bathyarchaeota archaeon]